LKEGGSLAFPGRRTGALEDVFSGLPQNRGRDCWDLFFSHSSLQGDVEEWRTRLRGERVCEERKYHTKMPEPDSGAGYAWLPSRFEKNSTHLYRKGRGLSLEKHGARGKGSEGRKPLC